MSPDRIESPGTPKRQQRISLVGVSGASRTHFSRSRALSTPYPAITEGASPTRAKGTTAGFFSGSSRSTIRLSETDKGRTAVLNIGRRSSLWMTSSLRKPRTSSRRNKAAPVFPANQIRLASILLRMRTCLYEGPFAHVHLSCVGVVAHETVCRLYGSPRQGPKNVGARRAEVGAPARFPPAWRTLTDE